MKHTILTLFCLLILHAFCANVFAGEPAVHVSEYIPTVTNSSHLAIHGMHLVWQAKGGLDNATSTGTDWEIFAYDLASGSVSQITDDTVDDFQPQTDGMSIVWQKHEPREGNQIFLYRLNGSSPQGGTKISTAETDDNFSPDIAEGMVIWSRHQIEQTFGPREVLLYNVQTQTGPTVISNPALNCSAPRIAANLIIFEQENPDSTRTLYLYDISEETPEAKPAPADFSWYANSQVDGEQTVLARYSGAFRQIVLHSKKDGYINITDKNVNHSSPVISQNHIAWVAGRDIYLSDIAAFMQVQTTHYTDCWATGFLASWDQPSGGVDAYYLDVSTDPNFQSFVDGFNALNVGTVTRYGVKGLTPGTTYYYRVYASINGSTTAPSKVMTVKLSVPSPIGSAALPFIYKLLLE